MKLCWFDTETTGLDPEQHDIIQIAGLIEIDGDIKEKFEFKVAPVNILHSDPAALKIHGYNLDQIATFPEPSEVFKELIKLFSKYINPYEKTDKFLPAGHNVFFDMKFLHHFFLKMENKYFGSWFWRQGLDTMHLAVYAEYIKGERFENHKLQTLCDFFKIPIQAHDAMADIEATRYLFALLRTIIFTKEYKKHRET